MIDNYTLNNFEQLSSVKQACDASVTLKSKSTAGKINPALDPVKKNTSVYQIPLKKPTNPAYTAATYKHHNFLKSEYELARAQVASDKRVKNTASLVQCNDDRNNNTTLKVASSVCRPGVVTIGSAGLKKSGAGDRNVLPEITRAKILTSATQSADLQKRRARSTCETEGNIKTITTTKTATAAVSTKPSSAAAGNKLHINNNMQGQQQCLNLQDDDIKYIDSDDLVTAFELKMDFQQQRCCQPQPQHRAKTRPKSTIICSVNQQAPVFQKVNKYTTGSSLSELNSASPEQHRELNSGGSGNGIGIDSISIKASIEKFNNLSKQKRIPLPFTTPTLRSQCKGSGSGSTSNLQHNRYSSDFSDAYNARLQSSVVSGGSLTRSSTRNYDASSVANKVVTNIYAGTATSSTSSVAVKTRIHYANSQSSSATTVARGSGNCNKSTESSPTHVSAAPSPALHRVLPRTTDHRNSNGNSSAVNTVAVNVSEPRGNSRGSECNDNKVLYNSCDSDTDDSIRSSSTLRSALPPPSPTPSRYRDRDSNRITYTEPSYTDAGKSSDEKTEGLCGLRNIGNTCFMNSVIQCLSHTIELTKFLRAHSGAKAAVSKDQQILYEFAKLIREMWTTNVHSVTPLDLKRAFSTKHRMYSDYNQQDAQEFLRFFLDSLHCALNTGIKGGDHLKIDDNLSDNKKADLTWEWYTRHENSLIRDLFVGQLKSTLKCTTCGNTSVTFDPFWDLSVPLPSSSRCKLDSCLDLFIREEILDGDEMPTCSKCHTRRRCTKSFSIQRFPKYLVIHLKRFSETRWSKLSNIVEFPTGERELNMGPYGSNHHANVYYSLYGISNHMGSTAGGHYVALCKHPISKKWHEFNDNIVSDDLSENHLISSSAYILFYERA